MTDPQVIKDDVIRGHKFYTNLIQKEIYNAHISLSKCNCGVDTECLMHLLKALDFRIEQDKFDKTTENLHRDLILIIGTYTPPIKVRFYYNISNTDIITLTDILNSPYIDAISGSEPIIPFNTLVNNTAKYNWMAELQVEPVKTKWQDTVVSFNNGDIGPGNTFRLPVVVSNMKYYMTDFETQFSYPIQFKIN